METPKLTPDGTGERPETPCRRKTQGWVLGVVGLAAMLGFVSRSRNCRLEHERHAVAREVREVERRIRSHAAFWLYVEGNDSRESRDPIQEARHETILRDFERLSHLDNFEMANVAVDVRGDEAHVSYRVRGIARAGGPPLPAGGEMQFRRDPGGWRLTGHRLIEARPHP